MSSSETNLIEARVGGLFWLNGGELTFDDFDSYNSSNFPKAQSSTQTGMPK